MEISEISDALHSLTNSANTIVHNQRILAGVHQDLEARIRLPYEEDLIYRLQYGHLPAEAVVQELEGVRIQTRILHRQGLRAHDVAGADLLYEIENRKFGLIQYKRAEADLVEVNRDQLTTLLDNCPAGCTNKKKRPIPTGWLPTRVIGLCGCWYGAFLGASAYYVQACEVESLARNCHAVSAAEFTTGYTQDEILRHFASCRLGAPISGHDRTAVEAYERELIEQLHLVIEVQQRGRWAQS